LFTINEISVAYDLSISKAIVFPNKEMSSVLNFLFVLVGLFSVAFTEKTVDKLIAITVIMVFKFFIISILGYNYIVKTTNFKMSYSINPF
jgi:hypothetical protein